MIDHRQWHEFIARGWLRAWEQLRRGAVPAVRVAADDLAALLAAHPEAVNPSKMSCAVRDDFALDACRPRHASSCSPAEAAPGPITCARPRSA